MIKDICREEFMGKDWSNRIYRRGLERKDLKERIKEIG